MRNTHRGFCSGAVAWVMIVSGCSAGTTALGPADCRPGDSTLACCIKKHPHDPMGDCGASPSEIEQVLRAVNANEDEDDFANNASLPRWKQRCIEQYNDCIEGDWTGNCHDCFRYCEGQRKWPSNKCHEL